MTKIRWHLVIVTTLLIPIVAIALFFAYKEKANGPAVIPYPDIRDDSAENKGSENEAVVKPPIVNHFACGDYCPGPREKYMVKIYEGVTDEGECRKLGGEPYSYQGWVKTTVCLAK